MLTRREWAVIAALFILTRMGFGDIPAALGNTSTPVAVVFSRNGSNQPRCSTFNGSSWSASSAMPSIGATASWVVLKNCPTRNELACATLDTDNDVNVLISNGTTWGSAVEVCSNTVQDDDRCMSLEYEHVSGDFLVAYWSGSASKIGWRTWNGSTLSGESLLTLPSTSAVRYISLTQKLNSNEIMLLAMNNDKSLYAAVWNGSAFGAVTEIESNAKTNGNECFSGAYETLSGEFMVVYGDGGGSTPRYRIWNGSSWASEQSLPGVGGNMNWIRITSHPASDEILFGALDAGDDLNVNRWSGSSWGTNVEIEATVGANDRRKFDLAYLAGGLVGVVMYGEGTLFTPKFRYWDGSSWSAESAAMDVGQKPTFISGMTSQVFGQVFFATADEGRDLTIAWSLGMTYNTVETDMGGSDLTEPFMIATPGPTPPVPANIPYATNFQGSVGAEWNNTTTSTTTTYTKFLGRFYEDNVQLALNTVIGERYSLMFDLYTIDTWDGNSATYGPDYFKVSVNGVTQFSETFVNETPSRDHTYPFACDQLGSYGFGTALDGIYRSVEVVFTATDSVSLVTFTADFSDTDNTISNESWGIDNVSVTAARFIDVSSSTGFAVTTTSNGQDAASAAHWGDFDNDGDLDAILSGDTPRLMINNSAGASFSSSVFVHDVYRQGGLLDLENDGDLDYWTSCASTGGDTERIYENNGSASFSSGGGKGFTSATNNEGFAAADVDRDGWIDIVQFSENGNWIALNQGGTSVTLSATASSGDGLHTSGNYGNGDHVSSGDVNNDGHLDFFYHYNSGRLFLSDGDGTFTRSNYSISVITGTSQKTGSAWADYDNDRDLDLYVARNEAGYFGYLWRNGVNWTNSTGSFANVNSTAGVDFSNSSTPPSVTGMRTCAWGDIDNDGDLDLLIAGAGGKLLMYQNGGNGTFVRISAGLDVDGAILDAVFVDYDNDGDLDLSVTRESATAVLFRNQTNNSNYLKVRLIGAGEGGTNKAAVGVRLELWNAAGSSFIARRDIGVARGYAGSEPLWAHFGGVNPNTAYKLKVYFHSLSVTTPLEVDVTPSAASTTIGAVTISQMLTVVEPQSNRKVLIWSEVRN